MLAFLRWLSRHLMRRDITGEDGTLYLTRYRVVGWMPRSTRRWPFSIYLHQFHRHDLDDAPHSHPWRWAWSLVLTGGYTERRLNRRMSDATGVPYVHDRTLLAPAINRIHEDTFHVVTRLHGETWTLFVVGPKTGSWRFWVRGRGVVPWRERLAERGIEAYPPQPGEPTP